MQNIKITHVFQGLEPLVQAIDSLAEAIRNQEVFVVPTDSASEQTSAAAPEPAAPQVSPAPSSAEPQVPTVSFEDVRAKLASLVQAEKQTQVKELLASFGASKLSDVPAERYGELMQKASEIA